MNKCTSSSRLSFFAVHRLLRQHRRLAERRNPMFLTNKVGKWSMRFIEAFCMLYLLGFGIMFGLMIKGDGEVTPVEFIGTFIPFMLVVDFLVRLVWQQTPSQLVKPYALLPLPRYACIDSFVLCSLLSTGNLLWMVMLVPYCLIAVVFTTSVLTTLSLLLFFYLVCLIASQWYAVCRTLILQHLAWWALPATVFAAMFSPWIIADFDAYISVWRVVGNSLEHALLMPHAVALAVLLAVTLVNRRLQYIAVWREMGGRPAQKVKSMRRLRELDRWGETGQYLWLEIMSLVRNKNPRKAFFFATAIVVMMILVITFTDTYNSLTMTNFWGFYNFAVYGAMMLTRIMGYEANYIDGLMVRRENILRMLTAKYYFFCALLVVPLLLMVPLIVSGKWHWLMLVSYCIFTAGFTYFLLMQLAVYNKQKIPLNEKFVSKAGVDSNYAQMLLSLAAFIVPLLFISFLQWLFSDQVAWLIMLGIGAVFIATHKVWLANIYRRLMQRKYERLSEYHA